MKYFQNNITAILFLCCVILFNAYQGYAEELYQQFSLGGGNLTTAPTDAKAPEPGIVTAKYGFKVAKDFMPYMGTGLAYTYLPNSMTGDITNLRTGVAAQLGFRYLLGAHSTLKLDYKYLSISPELPKGENRMTPQSVGIGLDIKF